MKGKRGGSSVDKYRPSPHIAAVVKLGGSLAFAGNLRAWLNACRASPTRVIIVPGGGPFADTVRDAQTRMGLSGKTAHRMALLAMAQYAEALTGLEPGFAVATGRDGILESLAGPSTPIWAPLDILSGAPGIEESWDVTSDSLAAWLALDLGVKTLVLVKREEPPEYLPPLSELSEKGVVDRAFSSFIEGSGLNFVWLGASDPGKLAAAVHGHR